MPFAELPDEAWAKLLGQDLSGGGVLPPQVAAWLRTVRDAVVTTEAHAPVMFYGTDWLAFGHFVVGLAFFGAVETLFATGGCTSSE